MADINLEWRKDNLMEKGKLVTVDVLRRESLMTIREGSVDRIHGYGSPAR